MTRLKCANGFVLAEPLLAMLVAAICSLLLFSMISAHRKLSSFELAPSLSQEFEDPMDEDLS